MECRDVKWFPLDRIADLEMSISERVHSRRSMRDGIGCMLGLSGLRAGEACWALAKHFEPLNRSLYVCPCNPNRVKNPKQVCKPMKGGVSRTIRLDQSLVDAIVEYRSTCSAKASKWLLPNRSGEALKPQLLSGKARQILLSLSCMDDPSTRYHMLRHTCAMRILAETNDLMVVQKHLGHRDLKTTQVYAHCLRQVPSACLAKLYEAPKVSLNMDRQLSLFHPFPDEAAG